MQSTIVYITLLIKYSVFSFRDKKITNSRAMVYTDPGITNNKINKILLYHSKYMRYHTDLSMTFINQLNKHHYF